MGLPNKGITDFIITGLQTGLFLRYVLEPVLGERCHSYFRGRHRNTSSISKIEELIDEIIIESRTFYRNDREEVVPLILSSISSDSITLIKNWLTENAAVPNFCRNDICYRALELRAWLESLGALSTNAEESEYYGGGLIPHIPHDILNNWFRWELPNNNHDPWETSSQYCELHAHLTASVRISDFWKEALDLPISCAQLYRNYGGQMALSLSVGRIMRVLLFAMGALDWGSSNLAGIKCRHMLVNLLQERHLWFIRKNVAYPIQHLEQVLIGGGVSLQHYSLFKAIIGNGNASRRKSFHAPLPNKPPYIDTPLNVDTFVRTGHSHQGLGGLCLKTIQTIYALCRGTFSAPILFRQGRIVGLDFFGRRYSLFTRYKRHRRLKQILIANIINSYSEENTNCIELRLNLDSAARGADYLSGVNRAVRLINSQRDERPEVLVRLMAHALKRGNNIEAEANREMRRAIFLSRYYPRLRGFDVAGNERNAHALMFHDVYDTLATTQNGWELTYHAGEDPRSPICGLREIWNAIIYLNVRRIGHGVVLGTTPDWAFRAKDPERRGWLLSPTDVIENLNFVLCMLDECERINSAGEETFGPFPLDPWERHWTEFIWQCPVCVCSLGPDNITESKRNHLHSMARGFISDMIDNLQAERYPMQPSLWVRYTSWLGTTPDRLFHHIPQEIWDESNLDSMHFKRLLASYRNYVFRTIRDNDVLIEVCPSSNNFILHLDYALSHAHILHRLGLNFVLCTDNKGLFNKSIRDEAEHILQTIDNSNDLYNFMQSLQLNYDEQRRIFFRDRYFLGAT